MPLEGSHILLGVSGTFSAYRSCDLVRSLAKAGASLRVVMTQGAARFVTPLTFETLSGHEVEVGDPATECLTAEQVSLARWADLLVIAPATAGVISKLAHGIADDLLVAIYLAYRGPVIVAPAMSAPSMEHPATQGNLEALGRLKAHIIPPRMPDLSTAEGSTPVMAPVEDLLKAIAYSLGGAQDLEGFRFLVTGGPTREHIDPVRFLSNPSSGKMGLALAEAARKRGAAVTFVHGPLSDVPSRDVEAIPVTSVVDMFDRVMERLAECDVLISAANPGDFVPEERQTQKIRKDVSGTVTIKLKRAPDILAEASRRRREGQILVGFAVDVEHLLEGAKKKLKEKALDMVVATDFSGQPHGFLGETVSEYGKVLLVTSDGAVEELESQEKHRVAQIILDRVRSRLCKTS